MFFRFGSVDLGRISTPASGLFHLRFPRVGEAPLAQPDTEGAFRVFLERDDLDAETRAYALACLAGDAQ